MAKLSFFTVSFSPGGFLDKYKEEKFTGTQNLGGTIYRVIKLPGTM